MQKSKLSKQLSAALLLAFLSTVPFLLAARGEGSTQAETQKTIDPAAWGSNHVGKPTPEYVTGDECLFCHRNDIGPTWQKNPHALTVRSRENALDLQSTIKAQPTLRAIAPQVEFFLGSRRHIRFLKQEGYGRFAILNLRAERGSAGKIEKWIDLEKPSWDKEKFANRCAGCHATAVDPANKTFSAFSLDCYSCHGAVDLDHTKDTSLVLLSKKRRREYQVITSLCAQCHIRIGASRSTGLPYPNNFVAGDNLFQDFAVDFSKADDAGLNAGDRHVLRNVRDLALYGADSPTCLSCHDVHAASSLKHRRLPRTRICSDCHEAEGPLKTLKPFTVHSKLCEY
jgi:predicted CXXCH cytochrome family protein